MKFWLTWSYLLSLKIQILLHPTKFIKFPEFSLIVKSLTKVIIREKNLKKCYVQINYHKTLGHVIFKKKSLLIFSNIFFPMNHNLRAIKDNTRDTKYFFVRLLSKSKIIKMYFYGKFSALWLFFKFKTWFGDFYLLLLIIKLVLNYWVF